MQKDFRELSCPVRQKFVGAKSRLQNTEFMCGERIRQARLIKGIHVYESGVLLAAWMDKPNRGNEGIWPGKERLWRENVREAVVGEVQ
jgi:hypothetical protein